MCCICMYISLEDKCTHDIYVLLSWVHSTYICSTVLERKQDFKKQKQNINFIFFIISKHLYVQQALYDREIHIKA